MTNTQIEHRSDCDSFEPKRFKDDCGECQTDGHYLCAGCRYIAPFEDMEVYDNMLRYYYEQAIALKQNSWLTHP